MPSLPIFQSDDRNLSLMQTKWASVITPFLNNPANQTLLLKNISLINGTTIVNHLLGRTLQGWIVVGVNGIAEIYDTQSTNQMPDLTLVLVSDADVLVNLLVF